MLEEEWESSKRSSESMVSYVLLVRERLSKDDRACPEKLGARHSNSRRGGMTAMLIQSRRPGTGFVTIFNKQAVGTVAGAL